MFRIIETDEAPKAIGAYSQAIVTEQFVFVSGQIPINPITGKIIETTIEGQAHQVLDNIEAILREAALTFDHIVKAEIYLLDLDDSKTVNTLYGQRFNHPSRPARQMMQVARLPLDSLIEISCIALRVK